jgi:hypothetical protein
VLWAEHLQNNLVSFSAVVSFFCATITGFLSFLTIRVVLPLLFYVPQSFSMRSMGLLEAITEENGMQLALGKYFKWHEDGKSIRVICINGGTLFGQPQSGKGPLFDHAKNGHLEVLMPKSSPQNPTIRARYETYKPDFKKTTYPQIEDLVRSIEISKGILAENTNNRILEHDELCMWRVVLLSEHCIVQNYFPNHRGCHSDASPAFVFEKEPDCPYSYYDCFDQMFKLLSVGGPKP